MFSAYVYISDCSHQYGPNMDIMDSPLEFKPVEIGDHCFVGIGSCIMPGVHMGNYVVVGANSVVTKDVPDYCMVAGSPARVIKKWDNGKYEWVRFSNVGE